MKNYIKKFRLDKSILDKLKEDALKNKLNHSEYIRRLILENNDEYKEFMSRKMLISKLDELNFQIKKIGVNINQIAKIYNTDNYFQKPVVDKSRDVLKSLDDVKSLIDKFYSEIH